MLRSNLSLLFFLTPSHLSLVLIFKMKQKQKQSWLLTSGDPSCMNAIRHTSGFILCVLLAIALTLPVLRRTLSLAVVTQQRKHIGLFRSSHAAM